MKDKHNGEFRAVSFLVIAMFLLPIARAIEFPEDTKFSKNNVNYIFKAGLDLDDFQIMYDGIILNEDSKITITSQGGTIDVIIYEWFSPDDNKIGFLSSMPQTLEVNLDYDGLQYYFYDGEAYRFEGFTIPADQEIKGTFVKFNDDEKQEVIVSDNAEKNLDWYQEKIFEFEVWNEKDEAGIIQNHTIALTWATFGVLMLILVFIGGLLWILRR